VRITSVTVLASLNRYIPGLALSITYRIFFQGPKTNNIFDPLFHEVAFNAE
jgi:hypothetical protein